MDSGRFPVKRVVGDVVAVEADVFADGHDHVIVRLLYKREADAGWTYIYMTALGNDRWSAEFTVVEAGRYFYTVAGAIDRYETWQSDLKKRIDAARMSR